MRGHDQTPQGHKGPPVAGQELGKDPVCGMTVPADAPLRTTYEGEPYVFCSEHCLARFQKEPDAAGARPRMRLGQPPRSAHRRTRARRSRIRRGSRRPRRRWNGPARCTRRSCGTSRGPARSAAWRWSRRCGRGGREREPGAASTCAGASGSALALSAPLAGRRDGATCCRPAGVHAFVVEPDRARGSSSRSRRRSCCGRPGRSSCAPSSPFVEPQPQHVHADRARRRASAYVYSVVATVAAGHLPGVVPGRTTGRSASYFEAAAVIVTLVLLGQVLELRARSRTGAAIRTLLGLAPKLRASRPRRRDGGRRAARGGPGRRPPARAAGREGPGRRRRPRGRSAVDESMVTGEPIPSRRSRATG